MHVIYACQLTSSIDHLILFIIYYIMLKCFTLEHSLLQTSTSSQLFNSQKYLLSDFHNFLLSPFTLHDMISLVLTLSDFNTLCLLLYNKPPLVEYYTHTSIHYVQLLTFLFYLFRVIAVFTRYNTFFNTIGSLIPFISYPLYQHLGFHSNVIT